jgi:hypothetical protein
LNSHHDFELIGWRAAARNQQRKKHELGAEAVFQDSADYPQESVAFAADSRGPHANPASTKPDLS